jgi:hypothetical protein
MSLGTIEASLPKKKREILSPQASLKYFKSFKLVSKINTD